MLNQLLSGSLQWGQGAARSYLEGRVRALSLKKANVFCAWRDATLTRRAAAPMRASLDSIVAALSHIPLVRASSCSLRPSTQFKWF